VYISWIFKCSFDIYIMCMNINIKVDIKFAA